MSVDCCRLTVVSCHINDSVVSCQLSVVITQRRQHSTPSTVNSQQSTIPIPKSQCPIIDNLACGKTCGKVALRLWKTLLDRPKQFLHKNGRAIDRNSFSTSFPQVFITYKSFPASS
ncbi:hypothetical protein Q5691_10170 [Microcoleus sp. w1-18aA5]|uniref:hypothetical protein n=1 Tax=Microcoleus sp. w1-18aA5 TaxID=2818982 RepID=UPI002FCF1E78